MDPNASASYRLFFVLLCSILFIDAARSESVLFVNSPNQSFLRSPAYSQSDPVSVPDVAAAVSVLLGFPPSHTVSASSSSKLNDILTPSPFKRPRAVLLLEVTGVSEHLFQSKFAASLNRKINLAGSSASIQLPGRDEASVYNLDEPLSNNDLTDKHISDFARSIGGSYATDAAEPLNGEMVLPLDNGLELKLQMSKMADRDFTVGLLTLMHNVKKAIKFHSEADKDGWSLAELLMGSFDCFKGVKDDHRADGVVKQRMELFVSAAVKCFDLLLDAYDGQIVGVIFVNEEASTELASLFDVTSMSRSSRELAEKDGTSGAIIIARVLLVRLTIAWTTGIILLIATLLGVYYLMNMPLTRDTLLYSNVKLD